jgi:hypothetical protein
MVEPNLRLEEGLGPAFRHFGEKYGVAFSRENTRRKGWMPKPLWRKTCRDWSLSAVCA